MTIAFEEMSRPLDKRFKAHEECSICLEDFKENEKVSPLPCDNRHYFHTHCIKDWANHNLYCPLCNTAYTANAISMLNKQFTNNFRPSIYGEQAESGQLHVSNGAQDWPDLLLDLAEENGS